MAKKATKKVVAKPAKKPAKVKVAVSKKGETDKKAKKAEAPKKAPAVTTVKAKPVKAKVVAKPVAKTSKKEEKLAKAAVAAPAKKEKPSKVQPVKVVTEEAPSEIIAEDVEIQSSGRKGKKYEGATEEETRWLELKDKHRNIKPLPYKMSEVYQEKTPIEHKVLGWGFVISVVNDRLEVLFRSGIKHLISNYKTNA